MGQSTSKKTSKDKRNSCLSDSEIHRVARLTRTPKANVEKPNLDKVELSRQWDELTESGQELIRWYEATGDDTFFQEAVACLRNTLSTCFEGIGNIAVTYQSLGRALYTRFDRYRNIADLNEAIVLSQRAMKLTPPGRPKHFWILDHLTVYFGTRFKEIGDRTDLDQAIVILQNLTELRPPGHRDHFMTLNNLACALRIRSEHFGDRAELDQAIVHHQRALELTPPGHPHRWLTLNNLASALKTRFQQIRDQTDLDRAIVLHQNALELTPLGHPERSAFFKNLATVFKIRFEQIGDGADLDQAIVYNQSALGLAPPGHPNLPGTLHNLANCLMSRFNQVGDRADLDEAIVNYQSNLELSSPDHPSRSLTLINLANAFKTRFEQAGDRAELDLAILHVHSALELTPPGRPDRSSALRSLAMCLIDHLEWIESGLFVDPSKFSCNATDCRIQIINLLKEGTYSMTGGPMSTRLQSALLWAAVAVGWSDPSAVAAFQTSLDLLELLIASGRTLESRHMSLTSARIQGTRTLAVDGAACAIDSGQITTAMEMLEQGRGVLFAQAGRYRTQVDDLEEIHPNLAAEFRRISAKMETFVMELRPSAFEHVSGPKTNDLVTDYQILSREWDNVLRQIRTLDRFSTFLQPTSFTRLREAAVGGPVVVINFSRSETDAIVVRSNEDPWLVPLPDATPELITELSEQAHHLTNDRAFGGLLLSIWRVIVQPVVKVLRDDLQLPAGSRIWWCPTGAMAHLPLHAAGDYSRSGQNLPDLYIPSYTPTLSALIRARKREPSDWSITPNILVVGQPDTPGEELPYVNEEIRNVVSLINGITLLNGSDGTRASVISAITHHPCIHLACHGHSNQDQPFRSNFSLHGGPLSLLDITRQNLHRADLAFLSACHSASGNRDRPDEVLHLAAGMQFAGFRSVVGTMWALCDLDGPVVATAFYSSLLGTGGRPKAKSSAHALHRAVAELRGSGASFSRWACFVHFGC